MTADARQLQQRIRMLLGDLENWQASPISVVGHERTSGDDARDHWFNCGMSEAYDNVIDRLYWALGEER